LWEIEWEKQEAVRREQERLRREEEERRKRLAALANEFDQTRRLVRYVTALREEIARRGIDLNDTKNANVAWLRWASDYVDKLSLQNCLHSRVMSKFASPRSAGHEPAARCVPECCQRRTHCCKG
jgi:hypothetical protein